MTREMILGMSNLRVNRTGIQGVVIWVSAGEFEGKKSQHGPRIKVALGNKISEESRDQAVTVTLTVPPKVLGDLPAPLKREVIRFVTLNLKTLLKYWNMRIDTETMLKNIESIVESI